MIEQMFFDNWLKMKVWTMTVGTNIHSLYIEHNHVQFSDVSVQFYTFKENYLYSSVEKFMVPLWNAASQKIDGTCINDEWISSYFHWIQSYTADSHSLQYTIHCSRQEPCKSTFISLLTLPLSLLPLISFAKFGEVIITEARIHCR